MASEGERKRGHRFLLLAGHDVVQAEMAFTKVDLTVNLVGAKVEDDEHRCDLSLRFPQEGVQPAVVRRR